MTETIEKEKVAEEIKKKEAPKEIKEEIQVDISDLDLGDEDLEGELEKVKPKSKDWLKDDTVMPVAAHVHAKDKLKGKLGEANDEVEKLKAENERLRKPSTPTEKKLGPMPKKSDYDDDLKYEVDVRKWHADVAKDAISRETVKSRQSETVQNTVKLTKEAVNTHYERAETFVKENGISEEVYSQADKNIRSAIESVFPGYGDVNTDKIISALNVGSEKAMLIVGRNQEKLDRFTSLLREDPNGLKATAYLGSIIGQYKKKTKQTSLAPSPVPDVKSGERSSVVPESSLKKMWKKADKNGDTMKAYNIYAKAKKAGVDVSKWR